MLTHRLHILLDEDRHRRLLAEAARRSVAASVIVREGLDAVLPVGRNQRRQAWEEINAMADQDAVLWPKQVRDLLAELDEVRAGR